MVAVALAASAQLVMIGIVGEYVGRIYKEINAARCTSSPKRSTPAATSILSAPFRLR